MTVTHSFGLGMAAVCIVSLMACTSSPWVDSSVNNDRHTPTPLDGTAWRLLEIQSMDDQVFRPEGSASYTLTLDADGRAAVLADCNRAQGTWTVTPPSGLEFGPLAATMAICPPGSLHDRFLSDLTYVRSYVMKDSHLFLATLADGAILEFEPLPP